jgi:hypothetical protein
MRRRFRVKAQGHKIHPAADKEHGREAGNSQDSQPESVRLEVPPVALIFKVSAEEHGVDGLGGEWCWLEEAKG